MDVQRFFIIVICIQLIIFGICLYSIFVLLRFLSYHRHLIMKIIFIVQLLFCCRHISLYKSLLKSSSRIRNSTTSGNLSKVTDSGKHSLIPQPPSSDLNSQSNLDNTLLELDEYSSDVPLEQINWSWQAYAALDGLLCLYKEPDQPSEELVPLVQRAIVSGLNAMPHNPERHVVRMERLPLTIRSSTPQATPAIASQRSPSSPIAKALPINPISTTESLLPVDSSDSSRSGVSKDSHSSSMESLVALDSERSLETMQPPLPCKYVVHTEPDWSDSRLGTTLYSFQCPSELTLH